MAYYNMGNVYKTMNKIEDSINAHNKSIEINPRYAYPYNNLGNIYNYRKNYDEAIKCFKKQLNIDQIMFWRWLIWGFAT